jgi:hypothetical protein
MSDEWQDPVPAKKMSWNGSEFDSLLECAWAKTLEAYGFQWKHHPVPVTVDDEGTLWEPDFLCGDVLLEVKPYEGESTDRLWKAYAARKRYGLPVLVARPGVWSDNWDDERPGLEWESCDEDEYVAVVAPEGSYFKRELDLTDEEHSCVHFRASMVLSDLNLTGLEMRHHSDEV